MAFPSVPPVPTAISGLPTGTTPLGGGEWVPVVQGGVTVKVPSNGFSVVGPTGNTGPAGPAGPTGPAGGVANINSGTINDLAYYAASGQTLSALATANSGILVTSSGGVPSIATAIPNGVTATTQSANDNSTKVATTAYVATAVAAAPSGLVLLATINASGAAAVVFSSTYITSTYNKYQIEFDGVFTSASTDIALTVSTDNGSTYKNSAYYNAASSYQIGATPSVTYTGTATGTLISLTQAVGNFGGNSNVVAQGTIKFANPSATQYKTFQYHFQTSAEGFLIDGSAAWTGATTAINNIMFAPSSGTITGNFHLYGIQGT